MGQSGKSIGARLLVACLGCGMVTAVPGVCQTVPHGSQAASKRSQAAPHRNLEEVPTPQEVSQTIGPYFALVIGNKNYQFINQLATPIDDADAVAKVLRERYGFQVKLLHDATRVQIITALAKYRELPDNSNLLIYYAGHGFKDPLTQDAYWFPIDAERGNNANWISAHDISDDIRAIAAKHILIISDSCFSGELSLGRDPGIRPDLVQMIQRKSRNLLASGGNEPVSDLDPQHGSGDPVHSVFANVLLQSLREMGEDQFNAGDMFVNIQHRVSGRSQQLPQYSSIRDSGHDGGDFVFVRNTGPVPLDPQCAPACGDLTAADQEAAVRDFMVRYQSAFEEKNIDALARLWPGMPPPTRKANTQFFERAGAVKMNYALLGKPVISKDAATIRFSQELSFVADGHLQKVATPQITITLTKAAGQRGDADWQISAVK